MWFLPAWCWFSDNLVVNLTAFLLWINYCNGSSIWQCLCLIQWCLQFWIFPLGSCVLVGLRLARGRRTVNVGWWPCGGGGWVERSASILAPKQWSNHVPPPGHRMILAPIYPYGAKPCVSSLEGLYFKDCKTDSFKLLKPIFSHVLRCANCFMSGLLWYLVGSSWELGDYPSMNYVSA